MENRASAAAAGELFSRRRLLQILWPLVVEQLLAVLVGMVDVLMVAVLGEASVSGVSLVDSLNVLVAQMLFALTAGGTVVCARQIGAGNGEKAGKCVAQLMGVTVCTLSAVTALFLLGGSPLLHLLFGGVEAGVMADALKYMRYTACSFPFLALYCAASSGFRAAGNTRLPMLTSLGMNLLNIAGNALCIFGLRMGVEGVALPTLLSRAVAACVMLFLLQRRDSSFRVRSAGQLAPDGEMLSQILSIGLPNAVESSLFNVGKVMLQSLVSTLGTASIAAYAVASNLATYLYLPGNALSAGMITVVGQCCGAGRPDEAKRCARTLLGFNYGMLAVICGLMIPGRRAIIGLYNLSPEASALAAGLILSHCIAMVIWPVAFLLPPYFRAVGRALFTMAVALFAMAVFRVGLANLFVRVFHRNVLWVWYAMFADWIFRIFIFGAAFVRQKAEPVRSGE